MNSQDFPNINKYLETVLYETFGKEVPELLVPL